jgi:hypothetical protein
MGEGSRTKCYLSPKPNSQCVFASNRHCSRIANIAILLTVYYKLYDNDVKEMLPSRHPVGSTNDPTIGQIDTCQIPGPHTIDALAKHICKQENRYSDEDNLDGMGTEVFKTSDSPAAYKPSDRVDLLGDARPGLTPQEPVLLKIWYIGE